MRTALKIATGVLGGGAIDTTAPTVAITSAESQPATAATPIPIVFALSEPSADFALEDITIANGTGDNFAGSGASYTCDVTPDGSGLPITVDVAADAFHDAAGNGNEAATQFSIGILQTLNLQPDGDAGLDNCIYSDAATQNNATVTTALIGEQGAPVVGRVRRLLIKFDLSTLSVDAVLTSAVLSLYEVTNNADVDGTIRVYRSKRAWVEDESTWNIYSTGNNWQTAGGFGADDCEQAAIGERAFTALESINEFKDFPLTPTSKANLDLGNGWLIKAVGELNDGHSFATSDNATAGNRPKLVVQYYLP